MDYCLLDMCFKIYVLFASFIVGALFASGLMCLSWRMTHHQKWSSGRSHCDTCGHTLSAKDLIPIFSWLSTKGKCRYCGHKIGVSTLLGELFLAIVTMLLPVRFGLTVETLKHLIFIYLLFCIALCDLYSFEIPDRFWIIGSILFVVFLIWDNNRMQSLLQGLLGGLVIAAGVFVISLVMSKVLGKEAMGFGDIKLMFFTGLYLGLLGNLLMLLISCFLGLGLSKVLQSHAVEDDEVPEGAFPFGPAIALSAIICVFIGEPLINLYLSLF